MGRGIGAGALVCAVALLASIAGIRNQWALDDIPLIERDARAHSFALLDSTFASPYWPAPMYPDLYRPFSTLSFTVQWTLGGGSPLVFRVVSYLLYAAAGLACLVLAGRVLSEQSALAVALLFAAHPVHVEAVALGVNQSEQWVAILSMIAAIRYLDARRRGWLRPRDWGVLTALYVVACLFKENAVVMPGLLLVTEFTLIDSEEGGMSVSRRLAPGFAAMAMAGVLFLALRAAVLGDVVGAQPAYALIGLGVGGRVLTMLPVVREWLRLLIWPDHLQADYSPAVIEGARGWGWEQTRGAFLLAALACVAFLVRRRSPPVVFGLLWTAIALVPVSNVLAPTGITLAERTLFLPSVGFLIASVALVTSLAPRAVSAALPESA